MHTVHACLPAGFSVKQLMGVCQALAAAGGRLPHLAHISMGMELDALLSSSGAAGVAPLAGLTQLTSLAFVEYQVRGQDGLHRNGSVSAALQPVTHSHRISVIRITLIASQHMHCAPEMVSSVRSRTSYSCTSTHGAACPAVLLAVHAPRVLGA